MTRGVSGALSPAIGPESPRPGLGNGDATVEIVEGNGVVVYGSVIDNRTNDPSTVAMVR